MQSLNRIATYALLACLLVLSACVFARGGWGPGAQHDQERSDRFENRHVMSTQRPGSDPNRQYDNAGADFRDRP